MSQNTDYAKIVRDGLWDNNPGLVMLLGLCPLLAVSSTVVNGVGLGLATTIVTVLSSAVVSLISRFAPDQIRIPIYIMVIATLVTIIQLVMNAWMQPLYVVLGIFIPLIVVNCVVLGRAESFASKNPLMPSIVDGFMMGIGLTLALGLLGALREILGKGTLLSGIELALGDWASSMVITVFPNYKGFLLAILPPGAFIGMGLLIAGKSWMDARKAARQKAEKLSGAPQAA